MKLLAKADKAHKRDSQETDSGLSPKLTCYLLYFVLTVMMEMIKPLLFIEPGTSQALFLISTHLEW